MSAIGDSEKKYKEALYTIFYNFSVNLKLHQNKYLKIYVFWLLSEKSVAETTEEYWLPWPYTRERPVTKRHSASSQDPKAAKAAAPVDRTLLMSHALYQASISD